MHYCKAADVEMRETMNVGQLTQSAFLDDDQFLLKHLPGNESNLRELRAKIHSLNIDNLELVKFVLLVGPTGTGKNHVARVCAGHRRWLQIRDAKDELDPGKSYVDRIAPLDEYLDRFGEQMLPAIPEGLVESHLFGHVKGAFSGALKDNPGLFRDEGYQDILLDEIGEAPSFLQAKLLAVLEGRPFTPVGGISKQMAKCDKRIFMATNRDLPKMVAEGTFREDLFFRVRRYTIKLRPLSDSPDLIPDIAAAIIDRLWPKRLRNEDKRPPALSAADNDWLKKQRWDGNVRELEEVIELWISAGCPPDVHKVAATRHFSAQRLTVAPQDVNTAVRTSIREILAGKRKAPRGMSAFIDQFTATIAAEVGVALQSWYREEKPTTDTLKKLFPDMEVGSIRTQMSRFGRNQ